MRKDFSRAQFSLWCWRHNFERTMNPMFPEFRDLESGNLYPGITRPNGLLHRARTIEQLTHLRFLDDYQWKKAGMPMPENPVPHRLTAGGKNYLRQV